MSDLSDRTEKELRAQLGTVEAALAEAHTKLVAAKAEYARIERQRQGLRQVLALDAGPAAPAAGTIAASILGYLSFHGVSSVTQIANGTGVKAQAVRQNLSMLTRLGQAERVGTGVYRPPVKGGGS